MADNKWANWAAKKPKDSAYDSGKWSKSKEDYKRAEIDEEEKKRKKKQEGPGLLDGLKDWFKK